MSIVQAIVLLSPAIFFMGIFCFIVFLLLLLLNRKMKSRGIKIFEIFVLIIAIIMLLIPSGVILLMRSEIKAERADEYYVDSGNHASLTYDENDLASFEYEEKTYKELDLNTLGIDCFEYYPNAELKEEDACLNLAEDLSLIEKLVGYSDDLLAYKMTAGCGCELYLTSERAFYDQDDEDTVLAYYSEQSQNPWEWYLSVGEEEDEQLTEIKADEKDRKAMAAMNDDSADVAIDVYNLTLDGSDTYLLKKNSPDGIFTAEAEIICYEGDCYWISQATEEGEEEDEDVRCLCQKLPDHLSDQIKKIVEEE